MKTTRKNAGLDIPIHFDLSEGAPAGKLLQEGLAARQAALASLAKQFPAARRAARRASAALLAACDDAKGPSKRMVEVADRAIDAASRLRGLAALLHKSGRV